MTHMKLWIRRKDGLFSLSAQRSALTGAKINLLQHLIGMFPSWLRRQMSFVTSVPSPLSIASPWSEDYIADSEVRVPSLSPRYLKIFTYLSAGNDEGAPPCLWEFASRKMIHYQLAETLELELYYSDEHLDYWKTNFPARFVQVRKNGCRSSDKSNDAYLDKRLLACDNLGHCRSFLATKAQHIFIVGSELRPFTTFTVEMTRKGKQTSTNECSTADDRRFHDRNCFGDLGDEQHSVQ